MPRFISLVEILAMKSVENFEAAGYAAHEALQYSFLGFFAGSLLTHLLDVVLEMVSRKYRLNVPTMLEPVPMYSDVSFVDQTHSVKDSEDFSAPSPRRSQPGEIEELCNGSQTANIDPVTDLQPELVTDTVPSSGQAVAKEQKTKPSNVLLSSDPNELLRMGIFSAVVIFLHNLPEGLATYVSVIADPYAGAAVAFAIALHNIPEASRTRVTHPFPSLSPLPLSLS
jgi:zinc transporter ZupT